ncbi:MAG: hypothetical protein ACI8O8_001320 [Oleiphilaceae bacterium]|jgi:hypothetical protein
MVEFISDPELLTEQRLDIAGNRLVKNLELCLVCPELEHSLINSLGAILKELGRYFNN